MSTPESQCITGLMPGVTNKQETGHSIGYNIIQMVTVPSASRDKVARSLRLVDEQKSQNMFTDDLVPPLLSSRLDDHYFETDKHGVSCDRIFQRSCIHQKDNILSFSYSSSQDTCDDMCRQSHDCHGYTYHRQGGGGVVTSSPCVLLKQCDIQVC